MGEAPQNLPYSTLEFRFHSLDRSRARGQRPPPGPAEYCRSGGYTPPGGSGPYLGAWNCCCWEKVETMSGGDKQGGIHAEFPPISARTASRLAREMEPLAPTNCPLPTTMRLAIRYVPLQLFRERKPPQAQ